MSLLRAVAVAIAFAWLGGCDRGEPAPAKPAGSPARAGASTNGMEFSGERRCVDCDGIAAWLRLEQVGTRQPYRMVEVYSGPDHDRRFEEVGDWRIDGALLRLRSSQGGERVYARIDDGVLQARGAHGQRIPAAEEEVLEAGRFDSTP